MVLATLLFLMIWSPLLAAVLCYAALRYRIKDSKVSENEAIRSLLRSATPFAIFCVATALGVVLWLTMEYESGNGPLAFIFYGPSAFSIGLLIGCGWWYLRPLRRLTYSLRRVTADRRWDGEFVLDEPQLANEPIDSPRLARSNSYRPP